MFVLSRKQPGLMSLTFIKCWVMNCMKVRENYEMLLTLLENCENFQLQDSWEPNQPIKAKVTVS